MLAQRGISLISFLWIALLVAISSLLVLEVAPSMIEFYKIKKIVKSVASNATANATIPDLRKAYAKHAAIDRIEVLQAEDLEMVKEAGQIVISFEYSKKIKLLGPVSLLIEYHGSSADA